MEEKNYDRQTFDKLNYTETALSGKEFNACVFVNCNFTNGVLSDNEFIDCRFEDCNLSTVTLTNAGLKGVKFLNCKLIGIDFSQCKEFLFSVHFERCQLDYSSFIKRNLKKTMFHDCVIREANFTESDLTEVHFLNCNLLRTIFYQTNLKSANLKTAYNYSINPEINDVKQAKFSYPAVLGLLDRFDIEVV